MPSVNQSGVGLWVRLFTARPWKGTAYFGAAVLLLNLVSCGPRSFSDKMADAGWVREGGGWVYHLAHLLRIGDDVGYNDHHGDSFEISDAMGRSYRTTFLVPEGFRFQAVLRLSVAGAGWANRIFLNYDPGRGDREGEKLVGTMAACSSRNIADVKVECPPFDVTGRLIPGERNSLTIQLLKSRRDPVTPYDDIEIHDLRIEAK